LENVGLSYQNDPSKEKAASKNKGIRLLASPKTTHWPLKLGVFLVSAEKKRMDF